MAITATIKRQPTGGLIRQDGQRHVVDIEVTGDGVGGAAPALNVPLTSITKVNEAPASATANITIATSGKTVTVTAPASLGNGVKRIVSVEGF